jgi:antitoxin VapB
MGLNIKNEETHRLARRVAEITGESQTQAVTEALRERLERLERDQGESMSDKLWAIIRETAPLMRDGRSLEDLDDMLYDDKGLPK